ncbi:MAG TPA: S24/S26 family peptidase [Dysgonamonadaceae bacterium]|nr:S24/S26 family peptidase [Dysgonamonadaceae bacterium]
MQTKIIQNSLFFEEIASRIADGERVRMRAKGNSMLPLIRDSKDEVVLEKPTDHSFQKGRLLLVQLADKRYLLHRVKKIDNSHIVLHGDGNLAIVESCTTHHVIAEATMVIRDGKEIKVGSVKWNMYRYLWPNNLFLRRVGLGVYRRVWGV